MSTKEKLLVSAQKFLLKNQLDRAIKDYQKVVEIDPKDPRHRQKLGELLGRCGRSDEALEAFEGVARQFVNNGFFLKAIAVYKQMQKLDPGREEIGWTLADLNLKQGLPGNAQAEYRSLLAAYEKKADWSGALRVLKQLKTLDPENLAIRFKLMEHAARIGMTDQCREELPELVALLRAQQDFARLIKLYEIYHPLFPEDRNLRRGHAEALVARGESRQAREILEGLLKQDADDSASLRLLGSVLAAQDDVAGARGVYQKLLGMFPADLDLVETLIRICLQVNDGSAALVLLREWHDTLVRSGRTVFLEEVLEHLGRLLPTEEPALAALRANSLPGGSASGAPAAAVIGARRAAQPVMPAAAAAELPEEAPLLPPAAADGGQDAALSDGSRQGAVGASPPGDLECPLDFLETLSPPVPVDEPVAEEPGDDADRVLDLDLELEVSGEDFPSAEEVESEGSEEDAAAADVFLLEDLDLEPIDDAAAGPAVAEMELQEAEFYLQQDLLGPAEEICRRLLLADPDNVEAGRLLAAVAARRSAATAPAAADDEILDLTDDLAAVAEGLELPEPAGATPLEAMAEDDEETVHLDHEELESHFNLGIAYKEMGLLDDAIGEFESAMKNPLRRLDAITLKGMCLSAKGDFNGAAETYRQGLELPGLSEGNRISLDYEMGLLLEQWDKPQQALASFERVAALDPLFRDVGEKLQELRRQLGMSESGGSTGKAGRDRVSYV